MLISIQLSVTNCQLCCAIWSPLFTSFILFIYFWCSSNPSLIWYLLYIHIFSPLQVPSGLISGFSLYIGYIAGWLVQSLYFIYGYKVLTPNIALSFGLEPKIILDLVISAKCCFRLFILLHSLYLAIKCLLK